MLNQQQQELGQIGQVARAGGSALAPGTLERMQANDPDTLAKFQSGLGKLRLLGTGLDAFLLASRSVQRCSRSTGGLMPGWISDDLQQRSRELDFLDAGRGMVSDFQQQAEELTRPIRQAVQDSVVEPVRQAATSAADTFRQATAALPTMEDLTAPHADTLASLPSGSSSAVAMPRASEAPTQPAPAPSPAQQQPKPLTDFLPTLDDLTKPFGSLIDSLKPAAPTASAGPPAQTPTPAASGVPQAMPTGAPTGQASGPSTDAGPIDNSSREAFVRTAYPHMLAAAGGNRDAAEMMLAAAISENGDVGSGKPFFANNFFGIKGEGPAGSREAATWEAGPNGERVNTTARFAAYNTPVEGMGGFFDFLKNNSRYAPALARYQQTGDASQLFRDVNAAGYATDQSWADKVANIRATQVAPITAGLSQQAPAARPSPTTPPPAEQTPQAQAQYAPGSYTPNQINAATSEGLDYETALAVCGPAAAIAFARKTGRNPTMQEAVSLAREAGWTAGAGMAGPASEQRLLQSMGVAARLVDGSPEWQAVAADVQRGNPVIVSTPGHYFVAERYNPADGTFDFGQSAAVLKASGGRTWFKPEELAGLGMGTPRASLFMDSPASPSPSVVAGSSAPQAQAQPAPDDQTMYRMGLEQPSDTPPPDGGVSSTHEAGRFIPTPNYEPTGPAMRGVTPDVAYPRPGQRNRAVPGGDVTEVPGPSVDPTYYGRNRAVPGDTAEWREGGWATPPDPASGGPYGLGTPLSYRQPLTPTAQADPSAPPSDGSGRGAP
jgi:flagellum-specific peptidoglycan hydrolase FlgJ